MQGMVAGKRSNGNTIQRWEKDITYTFGTMATARICSQKKEASVTYLRTHVGYEADGGVLEKGREHHEEARHEIHVDALQIGDLRQRRVRARYKGRHR